MTKLTHALVLVPTTAIAIYLISEGKPALIGLGIALLIFDLLILLSDVRKTSKSDAKRNSN